MRAGLVLGAVWATKKSPALTGQSLLRVRCGETEYLAADLVGAGPGDRRQLMDNIILWIMAIAMVLGALDRMFGSRLGLGKQFEEGILAIGALSLSMLGILSLLT